jgi:hypothetical protein
MKAYIDKSALVAKIEDWRDKIKKGIFSIPLTGSDRAYATFEYEILGKVRDFLNTLEVKEVQEEPASKDLEREIKHYVYDPYFDLNGVAVKGATDYLTVEDVADIARHFVQWQKEQMITKACNYLFSHMGLFVTIFDDDIVENIERSEFIKKFRIAMEE